MLTPYPSTVTDVVVGQWVCCLEKAVPGVMLPGYCIVDRALGLGLVPG